MNTKLARTPAVPGSLDDVAQKQNIPVELAFMQAKRVIACDVSGSMNEPLFSHERQTKYDAMTKELANIQAQNPGESAIVAFSDDTQVYTSGVPLPSDGRTNMLGLLEYLINLDGTGMDFFVISDGWPDMGTEGDCLKVAKLFTTPINSIYIGARGDEGERFMKQLAKLSGGKSATGRADTIASEMKLLTAGKGN